MKKLVIVESPTKAKTLSKILDKSYIIEASMGHIRDLPKSGIAIDIEHDFAPQYEIPEKSKKVVAQLKKNLQEVSGVILATDPDREGEAISFHLQHIITDVKKYKNIPFERVVFHELTKEAVIEAFGHPGTLNLDLVNSQQARRVLDRLVGYKLSPLLWKKVRYGLSAGRVQSVAVRLVVERERERDAFKPGEYWSIVVDLDSLDHKNRSFKATLDKKDNTKLEIKDGQTATTIKEELSLSKYEISEIKKTQKSKNPQAPFRTSTLQQAMANVFGFNANRTMKAAQKLFEEGMITYHRTDSTNLSPQFIETARAYIKKDFGKNFIPETPNVYENKSKNAQEAHEAIRPTDLTLEPNKLKKAIGDDIKKVYMMIWRRSLECQMSQALYDQTTVLVKTDTNYILRATGSVITFDGFLAINKKYAVETEEEELSILPDLEEGEHFKAIEVITNQHFTQPPARYSDASLIKKLEELGIGRPSTYAPTLQTVIGRGYVEKEGRYFKPKDVAYVVSDILVEYFPEITGYDFTASMEDSLDDIALGKKEWVPFIREFYKPFEKSIGIADKALNKHDVTKLGETEEKCPECGKILIIKLGKYGKFLSCSNYPDCEYARPMEEDLPVDENGNEIDDFGKCENCDDGKYMLKQGKFGKFLACSNYPKCKTTKPFLEKVGMNCPKCGEGDVIVKKAKGRVFYGCSKYPTCDYASWKNPMDSAKKEQVDTIAE